MFFSFSAVIDFRRHGRQILTSKVGTALKGLNIWKAAHRSGGKCYVHNTNVDVVVFSMENRSFQHIHQQNVAQ